MPYPINLRSYTSKKASTKGVTTARIVPTYKRSGFYRIKALAIHNQVFFLTSEGQIGRIPASFPSFGAKFAISQ